MPAENLFNCKIFVGVDEIYSGDFSEVPPERRERIVNDLRDWAGTLGKRGLNELLYSHLAWYEEMDEYCASCSNWVESTEDEPGAICGECGEKPEHRYVYPRNEKLDRIITCTGLITEIRVPGS